MTAAAPSPPRTPSVKGPNHPGRGARFSGRGVPFPRRIRRVLEGPFRTQREGCRAETVRSQRKSHHRPARGTGPGPRPGALLTYSTVSSTSHWQEGSGQSGVGERRGGQGRSRAVPVAPPTREPRPPEPRPLPRPSPSRPAYLGNGQHPFPDAHWLSGLGVRHAQVVDLVASDLRLVQARHGRAPQHADGSGIERLCLHLLWRRAGHMQT